MAKLSGVYKITKTGTDQCYVGSSAWIAKRWATHKRHLKRGVHQSPYLQHSWSVHGAEAFEFSILELCDGEGDVLKELLRSREQHWIDTLQPCFNCCPAAHSTLGYKMPRAIVERHRQQITGRKLEPEHAAIVRGLALGLKRTPETKEKLRLSGKRRGMPQLAIENSAAARRGKPLAPEHVEKIRQRSLGRTHSPATIEKMKASNTPEVRAKKGAAGRGKQQSPEHVAKRIAATLKTKELNKDTPQALAQAEQHRLSLLGKKATEETRAKMRRSHLLRWEKIRVEREGNPP